MPDLEDLWYQHCRVAVRRLSLRHRFGQRHSAAVAVSIGEQPAASSELTDVVGLE